jgi:hypothetical protein
LSPTAHVERPPLSYLLFGLEGGLEALPLRVSNEDLLRSRVARAQESSSLPALPPSSLVISQGWGLIDLPLRAFNEGSPRPRVARAQKIIRLHPPPPPFV